MTSEGNDPCGMTDLAKLGCGSIITIQNANKFTKYKTISTIHTFDQTMILCYPENKVPYNLSIYIQLVNDKTYMYNQEVTIINIKKSDQYPVIYQEVTTEQYNFLRDKVQTKIHKMFGKNVIVTKVEYLDLWNTYQTYHQMLLVGLRHHPIWFNRRIIGEYLQHQRPDKIFNQNMLIRSTLTLGSEHTITYQHDYIQENGIFIGDIWGQHTNKINSLKINEYTIECISMYLSNSSIPITRWKVIHLTDPPTSDKYIALTYDQTIKMVKDGYKIWEVCSDGIFEFAADEYLGQIEVDSNNKPFNRSNEAPIVCLKEDYNKSKHL